jgi:hypothetical protein
MVILPNHTENSYAKASQQAKTGGIEVVAKSVWDRKGEYYDSYDDPDFLDLLSELMDKHGFDQTMENTLAPDPAVVPDMRVFLTTLGEDPRFELGQCPACRPMDPCDFK